MKKYFILFFLFYNIIFSQKLVVLEFETSNPIPFSTVHLFKNDKLVFGNYTNNFGEIEIPNIDYSLIEINCQGFESSKFLNRIVTNDTVFLTKKTINLEEVIVSNKKIAFITLGDYKSKKMYGNGIGKGSEKIEFFENTLLKPTFIKSFSFKTQSFKTEETKYKIGFRILIYNKISLDGKSDNLIETYNDLYFAPNKTQLVEIDLAKYNIEFPLEGIYIGIECLGKFEGETKIEAFGRDQSLHIEYRLAKLNRTYLRMSFLTKNWQNDWDYQRQTAKKYLNIELKKFWEPSFFLKVEK